MLIGDLCYVAINEGHSQHGDLDEPAICLAVWCTDDFDMIVHHQVQCYHALWSCGIEISNAYESGELKQV